MKRPHRGPSGGGPDEASPALEAADTVAALARQVAHEISSPLSAVMSDLELTAELLADGADLPTRVVEARRILAEVRLAAERIRVVVRHLQAMGWPKAGQAAQPPEDGKERSATAPPVDKRSARVLVVDDDALVRNALRRCLRDFEVVAVDSAKGALARLAGKDRFDLIICDLMMPGMTGADLHEEVVRMAPAQAERMVFLTGGAVTTRMRDFMDRVPNVVLEKPFDTKTLRELVRSRMR